MKRQQMVVFKLKYDSADFWGESSNFITKYKEGIPMNTKDVANVTFCNIKAEYFNDLDVIKRVMKEGTQYHKIGKPEYIQVDKGTYVPIFIMEINCDKLTDVVGLAPLFLIINNISNVNILAVLEGKQDFYHKVSHYFSFLSISENRFYDKVFFNISGSTIYQHLQKKNIGVLTKFLPLLPITSDIEQKLKTMANHILAYDDVLQYLKNDMELETDRILEGGLKCLKSAKKLFCNCDMEISLEYILNKNVLTFLLFCFSIQNNKRVFDNFRDMQETLNHISMWADGCLQLIENVIFHSLNHIGYFSFRLINPDSLYIKKRYGIDEAENLWIELVVTDYSGCYETMNMAQVFCEKTIGEEQDLFKDLRPKDFFVNDVSKEVHNAWKRYYSIAKNLVNHYGIKIFQNVVERSGGCFWVQSSSHHKPQAGESYCSNSQCDYSLSMVLPGTNYSIMFPVKRYDLQAEDFDYGIRGDEKEIYSVKDLWKYKPYNVEVPIETKLINAVEKENYIEKIADVSLADSKDKIIYAIRTTEFGSNFAEILYKSVLLAALQRQKDMYVVFYDCDIDFVSMFLITSYYFWSNLRDIDLFIERSVQICLYATQSYDEIIVIPNDWGSTLYINQKINFVKEARRMEYFKQWESSIGVNNNKKFNLFPVDILVKTNGEDTIFEQYVCSVINRNIQGKELGCKLENTHMRLGSTIHVNHFYEAEVLFGNSLFVERFASLLLVKLLQNDKSNDLNEGDHVTLYGYSNYSEQVIFQTMGMLKEAKKGIDVDYAILERETEDRGFTHVDQIRYNQFFNDEYERQKHFSDRKIICIIPIASTLKTNEKMINLFCEENGEDCKKNFINNFELILVGSERKNQYWKKKGKKIYGKKGMEISPIPEFFVEVKLDYLEPLDCPLCFPKKIIEEVPLVEVNAASTIPNQAFGLLEEPQKDIFAAKEIQIEEENTLDLSDSLLYSHLQRGENHFLFYFQTDRLILQCKDLIQDWLQGIKAQVAISSSDFVVIFCPSHFSNAGFVEYVNSIVFQGAAVVIRDDVDKEYRCNFRTKYSNLHNFAKKVQQYEKGMYKLRFFYVDDAIISGRTYQRSVSLLQSVLEMSYNTEKQRYIVFDGIFVLVDRNSQSSRWQYTGVGEETKFFAFRTLHISSLRNHGDACVLCNLENEARVLKETAVTKIMFDYWLLEEDKFRIKPIGKYLQKIRYEQKEAIEDNNIEKIERMNIKRERAIRRMVCTDNAMLFLRNSYNGNQKIRTLECIIHLMKEGCFSKKTEEAKEYFLSYCKVISRPFRVFDRAVKEAIFDFLLILCESAISEKSYKEIIMSQSKKQYLQTDKMVNLFDDIEKFVEKHFKKDKKDLISVLLKQLTELKSNFIIRVENINNLSAYAKKLSEEDAKKFVEAYLRLVKKLLGVSSDTSKSLWFDMVLMNGNEFESELKLNISTEVWERLYIENIRVYQDAYYKLSERIDTKYITEKQFFLMSSKELTREKMIELGCYASEYITPYQFKDFMTLMTYYKFYENEQITDEGKILIAANILLDKFIDSEFVGELSNRKNNEEDKILDKCNHIANYMRYILSSEKVVIIMEVDAEYDMWEDMLIEYFNRLRTDTVFPLEKRKKKEYIILGSSKDHSESRPVRDVEIIQGIQKYNDMGKSKGYLCDLNENIFLWELGLEGEYPVYLYCNWDEKAEWFCESTFRKNLYNRIRQIMQYYWKLNQQVFNRSNNGFFHELVATGKQVLIHSRYKAHSHTKDEILLRQYEHAREKKHSQYYQSDLLMLLADLNVSAHYRKSLNKDYYIGQLKVCSTSWEDSLSVYKDGIQFDVINCEDRNPLKVELSYDVLIEGEFKLCENDEILHLEFTNAAQETFLLIYSLIINAAMENRGAIYDNKVTVYLSKTKDAQLRITNEIGTCVKEKTALAINKDLQMPPAGEKDGISLWSMSRYVKMLIAHLIYSKLRKVEKNVGENDRQLQQIRNEMKELLSDKYNTYVEKFDIENKKYFSIVIPVLKEKYNKYLGGLL